MLFSPTFIENFVKVMFVLAGFIYVVFAFVVTRQIHVMKTTLVTSFSTTVQLLGYAHLVLAVGVLLLFLFI